MGLIAKLLLLSSAAIILILGTAHLVYTFYGPKLSPRDSDLLFRMRQVSPVISRETTMWRAWIGFNASHSFGAMLFGLVYGYLALRHTELIMGSAFLLSIGLALLLSYAVLAYKYWFSIPFRGILVALMLFAGSIAALLV